MPEYENGRTKAWPSRCRFGPNLVPKGEIAQKRSAQTLIWSVFLLIGGVIVRKGRKLFPLAPLRALKRSSLVALYQFTVNVRIAGNALLSKLN